MTRKKGQKPLSVKVATGGHAVPRSRRIQRLSGAVSSQDSSPKHRWGTLFRGPCRSWGVARISRSIQPAGTTGSSDWHLRPGLSCSASNAPYGTPVVLYRQMNDGRHSARALGMNERTAPRRPEPHRPLFDNTKRSIVSDQHAAG